MSQVVSGLKGKTAILPKTCREVRRKAFRGTPLKSIVLNEGLEVFETTIFGCENIRVIHVEEGC